MKTLTVDRRVKDFLTDAEIEQFLMAAVSFRIAYNERFIICMRGKHGASPGVPHPSIRSPNSNWPRVKYLLARLNLQA